MTHPDRSGAAGVACLTGARRQPEVGNGLGGLDPGERLLIAERVGVACLDAEAPDQFFLGAGLRLQPGSLDLINPQLDPFDELVAALWGHDHGDCRADPGAEDSPGDERPKSLYQSHDALQQRLISAARPGAGESQATAAPRLTQLRMRLPRGRRPAVAPFRRPVRRRPQSLPLLRSWPCRP